MSVFFTAEQAIPEEFDESNKRVGVVNIALMEACTGRSLSNLFPFA